MFDYLMLELLRQKIEQEGLSPDPVNVGEFLKKSAEEKNKNYSEKRF